jgi:serine/threonine protein kinase
MSHSSTNNLDATIRVSPPAAGTTPSQAGHLLAAGAGVFDTRPVSAFQSWAPPSVAVLQQALPQYEIIQFIARGGMGAVYKGSQKTLKRPVAIKIMPPDVEDGTMQFAARFRQEAQAMARLSHPNIVAVFDAGETPAGMLYFVMEFVEGTDLAQLIASEGRLEPGRAVQIITEVCEALSFAHREGIVHRDIKPSNIMIDGNGRVKVADFGLAKTANIESTLITRSDVAMGTPDFAAPEALIPGMKVDGRADIYAVGVMLYQMLTGKIPRGRFELPSGVVPQVNRGFDSIVDKAMQTDRDRRYSTATEMKKHVESFAQALRPEASAMPWKKATDAERKRPRWMTPARWVPVVTVLALGIGVFFVLNRPDESSLDQSTESKSDLIQAGDRAVMPSSLPQPKVWTNATHILHTREVAAGNLRGDGDWVESTKASYGPAFGSQMKDMAMRVTYANQIRLKLRYQQGGNGYVASIEGSRAKILYVADGKEAALIPDVLLPTGYKPGENHEAIFAVRGSHLSLWVDGILIATSQDGRLKEGQLMALFIADETGPPSRLLKLEYADLTPKEAKE